MLLDGGILRFDVEGDLLCCALVFLILDVVVASHIVNADGSRIVDLAELFYLMPSQDIDDVEENELPINNFRFLYHRKHL